MWTQHGLQPLGSDGNPVDVRAPIGPRFAEGDSDPLPTLPIQPLPADDAIAANQARILSSVTSTTPTVVAAVAGVSPKIMEAGVSADYLDPSTQAQGMRKPSLKHWHVWVVVIMRSARFVKLWRGSGCI